MWHADTANRLMTTLTVDYVLLLTCLFSGAAVLLRRIRRLEQCLKAYEEKDKAQRPW